MSAVDSRDRMLDNIELALRELTAAVGRLTTTITLQAQTIDHLEKVLEADGGLPKQVLLLRSDVDRLDEDFQELRSTLSHDSEKLGNRMFDLVKMLLPWLAAAAVSWLATQMK